MLVKCRVKSQSSATIIYDIRISYFYYDGGLFDLSDLGCFHHRRIIVAYYCSSNKNSLAPRLGQLSTTACPSPVVLLSSGSTHARHIPSTLATVTRFRSNNDFKKKRIFFYSRYIYRRQHLVVVVASCELNFLWYLLRIFNESLFYEQFTTYSITARNYCCISYSTIIRGAIASQLCILPVLFSSVASIFIIYKTSQVRPIQSMDVRLKLMMLP